MPIATEEGGHERGQALAEDGGESSDPIMFEVEDVSAPLSGQRSGSHQVGQAEQDYKKGSRGAGGLPFTLHMRKPFLEPEPIPKKAEGLSSSL